MTAKRAKEKLPAVPKPRRTKPVGGASTVAAVDAAPDLSYIAPGLRHLAFPVAKLQFHPHNCRTHSDEHIEDLAASLKLHGQDKNILASTRTDLPTVVCGNGTLRATLSLGREFIAVEQRLMSEAEENTRALDDNCLGDKVSWDKVNVAEMLKDVQTGCDPRLDAMMASLSEDIGLMPAHPAAPSASPKATCTCPTCGKEHAPEKSP